MLFRQTFDPKLAQYAYLVGCQRTGQALIIDPLRDIDQYVQLAETEGLRITAVAETHIHADFLSGVREFASRYGTTVYVSDEGDADWKSEWAKADDYDVVFLREGDTFSVGNIELRALHTPGHTPEHLSYVLTDRGGGADEPMGVITGDFVFAGDVGRPDLLESAAQVEGTKDPSARRLYHSVKRFLELPEYLQVWPGHGAGSACGKALGAVPQTTVGYERRFNAAIDVVRLGEEAFADAILDGQPEPPLYFARMKRLNKEGVPLLGDLPRPGHMDVAELASAASRQEGIVVDTRPDRTAFMRQHLPGALYAPLTKTFNTVVGSLVPDAEAPLYLIVEHERVEEAVRDLVRVGYDNIQGYTTPAELERYFEDGGAAATIATMGFDEVDAWRTRPDVHVLDVRFATEYAPSHVPNAQNIAYTRLADRLAEVPEDETLLVHCASGVRAAVAAAYLAREGRQVRYVDGTFSSWAENRAAEQAA